MKEPVTPERINALATRLLYELEKKCLFEAKGGTVGEITDNINKARAIAYDMISAEFGR